MLDEIDRHPHARAVLWPALASKSDPSHAYLFHGPGGSGKRSAARALAAELLATGSPDPASARARAATGAHPDLTWVAPSGAHEILVSDIDAPVVAAAVKRPFEASRRVFVIERADELGEEAANRMLKTLEEPAQFVHLILLTERLNEVMPTIRSRCQLVRFDAPPWEQIAASVRRLAGSDAEALACAHLSLGDGQLARDIAEDEGRALRVASEWFARCALRAQMAAEKPWEPLLAAVRAKGKTTTAALEGRADAELGFAARGERKRIENEWSERIRRSRRRVETKALDLGLQLVGLWYTDLACTAWGAEELIRNCDRRSELDEDTGRNPLALVEAVQLVEETRIRFQLNVSEDLACQALAYRLEDTLRR